MNKLINILKKNEFIPLDKFINIALYEKKTGYYMKKNPLGKNGDYITAPLISNLFGEMIAIWCVSYWEYLGKPKKIIVAELGPGDGSLCQDLLSAFKNFKDFYKSVEIRLMEKSNKLKSIQKTKIKCNKVKWIKSIQELNSGPLIFIANEFFDSLAIKQILKKNNLFFEKHVMLSNKKIKFVYKKAKKNLINNIRKLKLENNSEHIIEYPSDAIYYLNELAKKIRKYDGGLLIFDYGYTKTKSGDTLQSVKNHKFIDILKKPGDADITTHINYDLFFNVLMKNNLIVEKIVTQSEFLQKLGIINRAYLLSKEINFKKKIKIFYQLKKLLDQQEMGGLFKVLFAKRKKNKFSLGF